MAPSSVRIIYTASDARAGSPPARLIAQSPPEFDGMLDTFIEQYVLASLPTPEVVGDFHDTLQAYICSRDPLFLLRYVSKTERRASYHTTDGTRFRATDNAPAWWVHAALTQEYRIAPEAFAEVIATMPAHMFDVAAVTAPTASASGWHIAHIFDVKDGNTDFQRWTRADVVGRFVRNIHPCNYFPIAKPEWQRWGGDQRVIGVFEAMYGERYRDIWPEFLRLARADDRAIVRVAEPVHYSYTDIATKPRRGSAIQPPSTIPLDTTAPRTLQSHPVEYHASRLTFKRDVIEVLDDDDQFRVVTPQGTFQISKREFHTAFAKLCLTRSYRESGADNYPMVPRAAERFRTN